MKQLKLFEEHNTKLGQHGHISTYQKFKNNQLKKELQKKIRKIKIK